MPTEDRPPDTTSARVEFRPTATGLAVLGAIFVAGWLSRSYEIAVGFFVPLGLMMAGDMLVSRSVLRRRRVTVLPLRTVTASPEPLTLRASAPANADDHPIRLAVESLGYFDDPTPPAHLQADAAPVTIALGDGFATATDRLRYCVSASIFGLVWARQWHLQRTPWLHRAPERVQAELVPTVAVDEFAQLRSYVPGDRFSAVSWPVSARTGELHVRAPGIGSDEVTLVVDVGRDARVMVDGEQFRHATSTRAAVPLPVAQHAVGLAMTVGSELLEMGYQVRLVTAEIERRWWDRHTEIAQANPRRRPWADVKFTADGDLLLDGRLVEHAISTDLVLDEQELHRRLALAECAPAIGWAGGPHVHVSPVGVQVVS